MNHIHLTTLIIFWIIIAITPTFKLLVSSGNQVLVLFLVDSKGTWWPSCVLFFFSCYSCTWWPPKRFFFFVHKKGTWQHYVATQSWECVRMKLTLPKWGLGSLPGFSNLQSSIARAKTLRIRAFIISLKSYWNIDVENGFPWAIWTSTAQVMAKRKVESQISSLTPDH
jgi:hypothetical protein